MLNNELKKGSNQNPS